jgi:hypothetical protein
VEATSSAGEYACYIHQTLCSPPATTLIQALNQSRELVTIPILTVHLINTHLLYSTTTNKGHMRRNRQGIQSTRTIQPAIIQAWCDIDNIQPAKEICSAHDMFCFATLANLNTGTMYTNLLSALPVCSFESMQYIFVAYIYDLNTILVHAMPSKNNAAMITSFTNILTTLAACGYKPTLKVTENDGSIHQIQQNGHLPYLFPQPPHQCCQTHHCHIQGTLHRGAGHGRQDLPPTTVITDPNIFNIKH